MNNKRIAELSVYLLTQNEQKISKFLLKQLLKKQLTTSENLNETVNTLIEREIINPITENECVNPEMYTITNIENAFCKVLTTYKETLNPQTKEEYQQLTNEINNNNELIKQLNETLKQKINDYQELNNQLANAGIFTRKTPIQEQIKPIKNQINELETMINQLTENNKNNKQNKSKLNKENKENDKLTIINFLLQNYEAIINPEIGGTELMKLTNEEGLLEQLKEYDLILHSQFGDYLAKPITDSQQTNPKPYLIRLLKRIILN